jgi:hypothetical protein
MLRNKTGQGRLLPHSSQFTVRNPRYISTLREIHLWHALLNESRNQTQTMGHLGSRETSDSYFCPVKLSAETRTVPRSFAAVPQGTFWNISSGNGCFLPHAFQFIIHYHPSQGFTKTPKTQGQHHNSKRQTGDTTKVLNWRPTYVMHQRKELSRMGSVQPWTLYISVQQHFIAEGSTLWQQKPNC